MSDTEKQSRIIDDEERELEEDRKRAVQQLRISSDGGETTKFILYTSIGIGGFAGFLGGIFYAIGAAGTLIGAGPAVLTGVGIGLLGGLVIGAGISIASSSQSAATSGV